MKYFFPISDSFSYSERTEYFVYVDDNFHYDRDEKYLLGKFENVDDAISACEEIVENFLRNSYKKGMKFEELLRLYKTFGEDPFIVGHPFSSWSFAEKLCKELCQFENFFD